MALQNEERDARVSEMLALARKHQAKASLRDLRLGHLEHMLAELRHDYSCLPGDEAVRAAHRADAIADLMILIERERAGGDAPC
jgi:hypothetical protein